MAELGPAPDDHELKQEVRAALHEAADLVEPADDGLQRIWNRIQEADSA